jgi:E3 ubiquitin-protein ligase SIAH1
MDALQQLLEELECPVCLELFQPPVGICANGHSICGRCKEHIIACPICKTVFLNTRNITVEKVVRVTGEIRFQCKFHVTGCDFMSSVDGINDHEMICSRRPYKCPVGDCNWNSPLDGVKMHLEEKHKIPLRVQIAGYTKSLYKFGSCVWHKVITYEDELFVHVSKMNSGSLCTCVLHIGHKNKTAKFRYVAQIGRNDRTQHVRSDHAVQNCAEGFDQIVSLGACASLSPDVIRSLMEKRKIKLLSIQVRIYVLGKSSPRCTTTQCSS